MTDEKPRRAVVMRFRLFELADDQQGIPIEEAMQGMALPAFLKGATVYEVDGRKIIARPDDEDDAR